MKLRQLYEARKFPAGQGPVSVPPTVVAGWSVYFVDHGLERAAAELHTNSNPLNQVSVLPRIAKYGLRPAAKAIVDHLLNLATKEGKLQPPVAYLLRDRARSAATAVDQDVLAAAVAAGVEAVNKSFPGGDLKLTEVPLPRVAGDVYSYLRACLVVAIGKVEAKLMARNAAHKTAVPRMPGMEEIYARLAAKVKRYKPAVEEALVRLVAAGMRKSTRIPIIVLFTDAKSDKKEVNRKWGSDTLGIYARGARSTPPSYAGARSRQSTPHIRIIVRSGDSPAVVMHTTVHEVSHAIYSTLNQEQQMKLQAISELYTRPLSGAKRYMQQRPLDLADRLWEFYHWLRSHPDTVTDLDLDMGRLRAMATGEAEVDYDLVRRWERDLDAEEFVEYLQRDHSADAPTWAHADYERVHRRSDWLVHFSDDAESIKRQGFRYGAELDKMGLTRHRGDRRQGPGYNFAYPADSADADHRAESGTYGDQAVLFRSAGIQLYHYGDEESQVVFWGPDVSPAEMVLILQDGDAWVVPGGKRGVLFRGEYPAVAGWVASHERQYRKQLYGGAR